MILAKARDWCERNGVDLQVVEAVAARPAQRREDARNPGRFLHYGQGLVVVIGERGDILSVARSAVGAPTGGGVPKAKGGRGGQVWPTSWSEMRRRVVAAGLVIVTGTLHDQVRHPETGEVLGLLPRGERPSRGGYAGHVDLGRALLAAGFDIRNRS